MSRHSHMLISYLLHVTNRGTKLSEHAIHQTICWKLSSAIAVHNWCKINQRAAQSMRSQLNDCAPLHIHALLISFRTLHERESLEHTRESPESRASFAVGIRNQWGCFLEVSPSPVLFVTLTTRPIRRNFVHLFAVVTKLFYSCRQPRENGSGYRPVFLSRGSYPDNTTVMRNCGRVLRELPEYLNEYSGCEETARGTWKNLDIAVAVSHFDCSRTTAHFNIFIHVIFLVLFRLEGYERQTAVLIVLIIQITFPLKNSGVRL